MTVKMPETVAYAYQQIIDTAQVMAAMITAVTERDGDALGRRGKQILSAASEMGGVAAWIARDRRDAIMPAADDDTIITKGMPQ